MGMPQILADGYGQSNINAGAAGQADVSTTNAMDCES
jgi:hypothetical protein